MQQQKKCCWEKNAKIELVVCCCSCAAFDFFWLILSFPKKKKIEIGTYTNNKECKHAILLTNAVKIMARVSLTHQNCSELTHIHVILPTLGNRHRD